MGIYNLGRIWNTSSYIWYSFSLQIPFGLGPRNESYDRIGKFLPLEVMFNSPGTFLQVNQDDLMRGIISEPCKDGDGAFSQSRWQP